MKAVAKRETSLLRLRDIVTIPYLDSVELARRLPMCTLINGIAAAFRTPADTPVRQRLDATRGREILIMPAVADAFAGVKLLTVVPDNASHGRPVIQGIYTLFDFRDGRPLASMDAGELTARRTAAVSAFAARQLARSDASSLLLVGSGHLIPFLADAHVQVRRYRTINVWARDLDKASSAAERIAALTGIATVVAADLANAAREADVICCATRSLFPLIAGAWLKTGVHLDLVGGYRPDMREVDDAAIAAARIFVDTRAGALAEAGDLLDPMSRGILSAGAVLGDLSDLARGASRETPQETTVFKAVGTAAADLATAEIAWKAY